jgi:hypothetical protein
LERLTGYGLCDYGYVQRHRKAAVAEPNDRLRRARERVESPYATGEPLSRQELAELVNARVYELTETISEIDGIRQFAEPHEHVTAVAELRSRIGAMAVSA